MATILHLQATVQPDGKIEIIAPELRPGQQVNITIEAEEPTQPKKRPAAEILAEAWRRQEAAENAEQPDAPRHVLDTVQGLSGHRLFKTAEEVDAYICEERDSWE